MAEGQRVAVVYTPFVESDDRNKWHAKQGSENIIRLYRLVHDYFKITKGLDNIIWAYHTTQCTARWSGVIQAMTMWMCWVNQHMAAVWSSREYDWAVDKKKNHGKVIWWAELGIRGEVRATAELHRCAGEAGRQLS